MTKYGIFTLDNSHISMIECMCLKDERGGNNMSTLDFDIVRESIKSQQGSEVMIRQDKGRNRVDIQKGVICEAYPSVFTIMVSDKRGKSTNQLLSYTYTDILTKEIRMKFC